MHRHPRYFSHPLDIKPERFSCEFISQLDNYAYFPFGLGSRICLGKDLSLVMLAIMTATIAKSFQFELANDHSVEPLTLITLVPQERIYLKVRKRK
ncbi:Epi-isozizaene 5-monooxygenase/(E)-beta-farnesene synthase [compost metagenome]